MVARLVGEMFKASSAKGTAKEKDRVSLKGGHVDSDLMVLTRNVGINA